MIDASCSFVLGAQHGAPEMWLKGVSDSDAKLVLIQACSSVSLNPLIFSSSIVCNEDDRLETDVNLWLVISCGCKQKRDYVVTMSLCMFVSKVSPVK